MANKKVKFELSAIDKTKAAFNSVSKGLSTVKNGAATTAKAVGGVGLAFAGITTALVLATRKQLAYIDAIGKTAARTGLSTELLQAFQQGAIEAGSSVESAQKGLEKFTRSVGDATRGLKTQADIFKDLGVEIVDVDGNVRSLNDILFDTADGLDALGSEAQRATVLANLFGRSGTQFQEIFKGGAAGLREFIEQGKQLGFILDEAGINTVEKFNDRISQLKASATGLFSQIVVALSPALLSIADGLRKFVIEQAAMAGGFDQLGKNIALSFIEAVRVSVEAIAQLLNEVSKLSQLDTMFGNLVTRLLQIRGFKDLELLPYEQVINVEEFNKSMDNLVSKVAASEFSAKSFFKGMQEGLTDLQSPLEVLKQSFGEEGLAKTIEQTAVNSMKKFEDSIVDAVKTGKMNFKALSDYIIEQLLRIAIQQAILEPLTGVFGDFFKGFGGMFKKRALGGSVSGNQPYIVGEKGPELFVPNSSGSIVPNNQMQTAGAAPIVNFNISTVDAAGFDELLASRKNLITAIINNAMNTKGKLGVV